MERFGSDDNYESCVERVDMEQKVIRPDKDGYCEGIGELQIEGKFKSILRRILFETLSIPYYIKRIFS